jgi:ADP-ribose pyrophosphatase
MQPWKTLSREMVLDLGKFLKIENHVVELPDGSVIENWPWVIIPDYVNVVALTPENEFICFRQVKYAVKGTSLSVVGGIIEPGETPLEAAKRELKEETGYEAGRWNFLGEYSVDANRGAGKGNLFLALDAVNISQPISDDLEEQELLLLKQDEILFALKAGEFKALSWSAAVAMALVYLSSNNI